jgi:hypothetical protein
MGTHPLRLWNPWSAHHVLGEARADQDHLREALRGFEEFGSPEAADVSLLLRS